MVHPPRTLLIPGYDIAASPSYKENHSIWQTIRDCYAGEARIKSKGQMYLLKMSAHDSEAYRSYLSRAYFYNAVRRTHVGLMGSLFRKPPEFTIPANVKIPLTNISIDGEDVVSFFKKVGHELLLVGRYGVLVDFQGDDPKKAYLAGYQAENIYAWRTIMHKDRRVVDRIILIEHESSFTDYGITHREIYRILRLDPDPASPSEMIYTQDVIRVDAEGKTAALEKINFNSRGRTLRYIPFVMFNPMDLLPDVKPPVLGDIATLNITHYGSTAQLEHGRFYAGMPTYVTTGDVSEVIPGLGNPNPRTVGPSNVWELEKDAKAYLLEFTGHGLTFLENAVDSKQLQMQSLGGRLISSARRAAAMSSEAWQLLETGDEATLLDIAQTMDQGAANLLSYMAHIRGDVTRPEDANCKAEFNKEFVRTDLTARELRALQSLYERGIIPLDVMYYALREVSVIPIEYTLEDFKALLTKENQLFTPPPPQAPPLDPNKTAAIRAQAKIAANAPAPVAQPTPPSPKGTLSIPPKTGGN